MTDRAPSCLPDAAAYEMAARYLDNQLTPEEASRFEARLAGDRGSRDALLDVCFQLAMISESPRDCILSLLEDDEPSPDAHCGEGSDVPIPPQASAAYPAFALASSGFRSPVAYLSSGWPIAYLVATVVFAIGLTIAAIVQVSGPAEVTRHLPSPACGGHHEVVEAGGEGGRYSPSSSVVARITGMADCQWEGSGDGTKDSPLSPLPSPLIHIGDTLALRSGLLEITYDTGAKVILQGPVTYDVESPAGGYLSVGKLTARLEKGSGMYATPKRPRGTGSESSRNQHSSDRCPLTSDLFAIRTPTAIVTDLGTEFGVEVAKEGGSEVVVFDGEVVALPVSRQGTPVKPVRVRVGQSALIGGAAVVVRKAAEVGRPARFVRDLKDEVRRPGVDVPVVAYWRFERSSPPLSPYKPAEDVQYNAVRDDSGAGNWLDYWPGGLNRMGPLTVSADVPPPSMFRPGRSGGVRSFDSSALDAEKPGVLFYNACAHTNVLDFTKSFTVEGYFKTSGDQSKAGPMTILYNSQLVPQLYCGVNEVEEGSPWRGALRFTLFGEKGPVLTVALSQRNYSDGTWHYFAARFQKPTQRSSGSLSLLACNQDGSTQERSTAVPPGFVVASPDLNLFLGRRNNMTAPTGHFRGLIDEVRISRGAITADQLLHPQNAERKETPEQAEANR